MFKYKRANEIQDQLLQLFKNLIIQNV